MSCQAACKQQATSQASTFEMGHRPRRKSIGQVSRQPFLTISFHHLDWAILSPSPTTSSRTTTTTREVHQRRHNTTRRHSLTHHHHVLPHASQRFLVALRRLLWMLLLPAPLLLQSSSLLLPAHSPKHTELPPQPPLPMHRVPQLLLQRLPAPAPAPPPLSQLEPAAHGAQSSHPRHHPATAITCRERRHHATSPRSPRPSTSASTGD